MEISYKRETNHNYLVVKPENERFGYEARMLAGNEIRGLLRMRVKFSDGCPLYYYDITSKQPLNRLLETRPITRDEICQILIQIHVALTCMEEYMLGDGGILLEPENIYVEPGLFQPSFCLVPGQRGDFQEKLNRLFQYILKWVDHRDRECVVLAYGLYQESLKENYGMDDLLRLIMPEQEKREESRRKEPVERYEEESTDIGKEYGNNDLVAEEKTSIGLEDRKEFPLLIHLAGIWLFIVLFVPFTLWLFKGNKYVFELRYILAAADGILLIVLLAMYALMCMYKDKRENKMDSKDGNKKQKQGSEEDMWRILYADEDAEGDTGPRVEAHWDNKTANPRNSLQESVMPEYSIPSSNQETSNFINSPNGISGTASFSHDFPHETEEIFQTALLSERTVEGNIHRLVSKNSDVEDIIIPYYPYVIGKHKDLADHVLLKDTVSRFHLRIDEHDGDYMVTDLNSTNGTIVRGRTLNANETVKIDPGDSVFIADLEYIFT